jgi:hypothetical protein
MANLLEILNDPNYVNANLETKNAIFQKYAPSDENYSKANSSTQSAIKEKFGIGGLDEQGNAPNVFGEVAANAVPSVISGLGGLAQFPGKLADLATGTAPDAEPGLIRKGIGAFLPFASTGAREAGGKLEEFGKELKTPTLRRKEKERATAVEAAEGELNKFKVAGLETITDPSLLSSFLFEQAPNALGSAGVGLLTKAGLKLAFKNSSQATLNAAGTGASIATQVAQQGTDVGYDTYKYIYDELVKGGMSKEQANSIAIDKGRVAALEGGAISYALSKIPGAREFEKMLFRDAAKAGMSPATFLQGLRRGAVGGGASEMGEEGGGKFASNVGIQEVFPDYKLSTGLGETTAMAGIGGSTTSGVFGGLNARAEAKAIKQNEEAIAKANAPFQYVEPQTGTTMTASVAELDDPSLVFVGKQEVGGRQVYVYAPAEGIDAETQNAENPIVATTTTTIDGKESVKTRRADGSVYVDGVMVEPPRQAPEGNVAQSQAILQAEFEGKPLPTDGQLPLAPVNPVDETPPQVQPPATTPPQAQPPTGQLGLEPVNPEGAVLPAPAPPTTPPVAPVVAQPNLTPAEDVILQNRERSSPTSIAQMNGIANKPDYSRVSFSNSFTEGAPVIFGSQSLPDVQLGRKGAVVAGKSNRKIPVQYAVIESDQMVASNAVDGSSVPEYANPEFTGFRAVTNGRVAGLKEGYKRGTMGQYKQDLLSDDIHGISPDVISKMRNPVLVRVMPQDQVTKDIADESNTSSTLSLSATERAKNDANRIDLEGLSFRDDGAISPETVRGFVASMPQAEQQELIDNQGRPSRQAYDRLNAAIFYKAYGSDALVSLAAEAKSVDAANIINGLSQSAPQMAQLAGLGEYDIRPQVVEAAEMAINANRQGQKLTDVIAQQELISQDSIAKEVLQLFANNTRSAKKIGEGLRRIANDVNAEASRSQEPDMFGEVPAKKPAANVVEKTSRQIMIDAGYVERELGIAGFLKASEELKAEIAALELQMQSFGLDSAEIMSEIKSGPTLTPLEYYSRAIPKLEKAIAQAAKQGSDNNIGKVNVSPVSEGIKGAESLDQKPKFSRSTTEEKENAELVADNFNGKVVYQNGDISLIQGRDEHNDVVYVSAKGTRFYASSIEKLKNTSALFTQAEAKELLDARAKIEAQENAKHAANPFVTFKNGMAMSKNVSPELEGIFKQWKSLLKLNQNIYLSTIEDALANKDDFAGPQRRIGNAAFTLTAQGVPGATQALADGTRYILVDQNQSPAELIEILAHEMGHAHEQEMFNNAPVALQNQIKAEFDKWLDSQKGKTAKEFIYALRAKETAETTIIPKPDMLAKDMKKYASYWSTFSEWYADQTARWATTSEKPLTAVDKFFAKVAETLRSFFKSIQGLGFLPNTTFKQYMDDITATEIVAANPITSINEQMPLFATKIAQANLLGIPAAPNKPNKIAPASLQKPKPAAVWTAPDMNRKDTFIGLVQDRNISLKRVQQVIEKLPTVTQLQDNLNAYRLEDLAHGRVQVQTDDFLKFEFGPIVKEMNDNKVTEEQLTEYLLNRHAKEANELIASRNPGNPLMQDKGSSVTTKDAQDYLNNLPLAQKRVFESIAKKVDKIIEGTQDILLNNGIISKAELLGPDKNTAAENKRLKLGWRNMFEHYVPLRREETDYVLPSSSFKEIGSYSKSRTGSQKKVTDILSNVGIAREIAIVRSEKEKAKRAVYGLAVANPNPEFWMAVSPAAVLNQNLLIQELSQMGWDPADAKNIMAEPTKAYFNKDTGLVENKINTQNRYADFVLPVKINGQDRFVFFNPSDERAASVITALKNSDTQKLSAVTSYVGNITRYFAAVNTQYNLIFGAWNFARDVQGAMLNLTTTPLNGKQGAVAKGTLSALKDIYAGIKEKNQGTLQKNPADGSWQDFLEAGGKVGYRDQFAKINDTSTLVARELQSLNRSNVYKKAKSVLNWVSSVNDVLENAVRLSAYRVALKQNMSKDQAAELAKNLTVNFNRKGSATAGLSAYYAFLNASIQGTARLAQTIDPRTKSGRLIIAGGMAIGMAQSLALMAAGFDDDEPSEFLKERNLIIPTGWLTGKRTYAMWPMPLGFNILPNTGRLLIDGAARLADGKGVGDLAINALSMAVSSTNPLGGNAATLQSYMPTIADPFVAVYENKDAFGRPIAKEDRGLNPTPGYTRSREPANPIFQGIAEFMNTITSRDKDVKGLISPTADQLSYIAEQIGGGVYREASRAVKYAVNVLNGEETPEHQVPIAGKIVGDLDSNAAISQKFYTNVKNMAEHELVIKAHRDRRQSSSEYMRDNPEARLWQRANSLENEITKLNKTKKELYQREAPQDRIKRVEDQKIRMMKQFNDQVRRVQ